MFGEWWGRVAFCVLREKSLVAAKTEHGVNIMRRRRIEGRGGVKRGRRSGRARRGGVRRRRRPLNVISGCHCVSAAPRKIKIQMI
jgi:hypothetical protein